MNNLLSYCGLVDAISAFEKDLPVLLFFIAFEVKTILVHILKKHTEIFFKIKTDNLIFNLGSESWLAAQTKKMRNEPS